MPAATGVAALPGDTQMSRETAGPRPDGGPTGGPEGGDEGGGADELGAVGADGAESAPNVSSRSPASARAAASPGDTSRSRESAGPKPDGGSPEFFAAPSPVPPSPTFPSSGDAPRLAAVRVGQVDELTLPSKMGHSARSLKPSAHLLHTFCTRSCRGGGHGPSAKAPGGVRRRLR